MLARSRLGLKAIALLIAALLWVIVSARQPTRGYVRVMVAPELDSTLALLEAPTDLRALVSGRAVDIVKLHANPPMVHRIIDGDAPDTLQLDITTTDVRLPPEMAENVHVLDVNPRTVTLRFGTRASARVRVVSEDRVLVTSEQGARPADSVVFDPAIVRITGPRRVVRSMRSVQPYSLTIARGDTLPHVADLDTTGLGVTMIPSQVKVVLRDPRMP